MKGIDFERTFWGAEFPERLGMGLEALEFKQSGPFIVLPKGIEMTQSKRSFPSDCFCAYCKSKVVGVRCESCGAPVMEKRQPIFQACY